MTQPVPILYNGFEPDKSSFQSDALTEALNVQPIGGGYAPLNGFGMGTASLATPILGAAVLADTNANSFIYAGSGQSIYVGSGTTAFSTAYTTTATLQYPYRWQFVRFVGLAIAARLEVTPVAGNLGATTMTALTGSPPMARVAGVIGGNFLVLGNLYDGMDGLRPNRVRWSGFRNPNAWGTNVGTQADFNDMPDEGGAVQGIIAREFGTVFQRYAISRMTYVGPDTVFTFDTVEKRRGAISSGCIIDAGLVAAYIADDGFFLWDGTSSTPIGTDRVNAYFRSRLASGAEEYIIGAFDPLAQCVFWAYPTDSTLKLTERLIYSLAEDKWTRSDLSGAYFMAGFDTGYTLDQMAQFGPIDNITFSFDDPRFLGGRARTVGFTSAGTYTALNGPTLQSVLTTGDWQSGPGMTSFVNAIRPQVDASAALCAAGVRQQGMADALDFQVDAPMAMDRRCPMRAAGRVMRFRLTIPAGTAWTRVTGLEVNVAGAGRR